MSFNISLSGLNAAQKDLDVTSHNIANVATTGFKKSRAEFGDVYTNSIYSNSKTQVGSGVQTEKVSQQFSQGSIEGTDNALDIAISGEGFFVLSDGAEGADSLNKTYSRAGNFSVDEKGYVVNQNGKYVMTYPVNDDGTVSSESLDSTKGLIIPSTMGDPTATSEVTISCTLPADRTQHTYSAFDPSNSNTFDASTSVVVYDSLGETHTATYYFVENQSVDNRWGVFITMQDLSGNEVCVASTELNFDSSGKLLPVNSDDPYVKTGSYSIPASTATKLTYPADYVETTDPDTGEVTSATSGTPLSDIVAQGADKNQSIQFNFPTASVRQFGSTAFTVDKLVQDGSTVGNLTGLEIGDDGLVCATYSNGNTQYLGMIAMAKFTNPQGLTQVGDTCWKESLASGEPLSSRAGVGTTGTLKSSNLESSNVDLSASLVDLISAQRNYQANSKALEAASAIMQTILNVS